jgi:hypothetical protein
VLVLGSGAGGRAVVKVRREEDFGRSSNVHIRCAYFSYSISVIVLGCW